MDAEISNDQVKAWILVGMQAMADLCGRRGMKAMREELTIAIQHVRGTEASASTIIAAEPHMSGEISWTAFEQRLREAGFTEEQAKAERNSQEFGILGDIDGDLEL